MAFALAAASLVACGVPEEAAPPSADPPTTPDPPPDAEPPPVSDEPPVSDPDEYYRTGLVLRDAGLDELERRFGAPAALEREPVPNRHVPGQTDTILTVRYPGARLRIYQVAGGRGMLERAEVSDSRWLTHARPGVGTPADSVLAWLGEPKERSTGRLVYDCRTCAAGGEDALTFHLEDGRVARIEWAFYVD